LRSLEKNEVVSANEAPLIVRFDYIVRKVVKISTKESTENPSEDTINLTWFYTLDSIFALRAQQLKILESIKAQQLKTTKQTSLVMSDEQAQ